MLLAIDVGNTALTAGLFRGKRLLARGRVATFGSFPRLLRSLKVSPRDLEGVILSSVVPRATASLRRALKSSRCPKPLILGENIEAPIRNRYRFPSQVGQDRLVNGVGAYFLYGEPAIVVDFGTAVTLDVVSKRREYLGGLIVPGVGIALEALVSRTALLPRITLSPPKEFLGRDTRQSMLSGLFHGYAALCDGIVARLKSAHAPGAKVIATGGHCRLISPYCRSVRVIDPDLTLHGLRLTYESAQNTAQKSA